MSSSAEQYHSRAPRYILNPTDQSMMRVAPMRTRGQAIPTRLLDVSESGLSFMVRADSPNASASELATADLRASELPDEGEMIKIEFTVPKRKQIACFATVIRVETVEEWHPDFGQITFSKIAIQFRNLPSAYKLHLQKSLASIAPVDAKETDVIDLSSDFEWPNISWQDWFTLGAIVLGLLLTFFLMNVPLNVLVSALQS
jgi:hypothetical protein